MAGLKECLASLSSKATLVLIMLVVLTRVVQSQAQSCATELGNLNVCAPFVVPGPNTPPSQECCGALQAIEHDCLCNTLRIAARLPSQCNLAPMTCSVD